MSVGSIMLYYHSGAALRISNPGRRRRIFLSLHLQPTSGPCLAGLLGGPRGRYRGHGLAN